MKSLIVGLCLVLGLIVRSEAQRPELMVQRGHTDSVNSIAFSPDGRYLACGCDYGNIKLWDVATGKEMRTLSGHPWHIRALAFRPEGRTLVSVDDHTLRLWNPSTGVSSLLLEDRTRYFRSLIYSPDGHTLACMGGRVAEKGVLLGSVTLLDTRHPKTSHRLPEFSGPVLSAAFSRDSKTIRVEVGAAKETLPPSDVAIGRGVKTVGPETHFSGPLRIERTFQFWGVETRQRQRTIPGDANISFSPNGETLAMVEKPGTVRILDLQTGKDRMRIPTDKTSPLCTAFSPDCNTLAILSQPDASDSVTMTLWNLGAMHQIGVSTQIQTTPPKEPARCALGPGRVIYWENYAIVFSPDGKRVAATMSRYAGAPTMFRAPETTFGEGHYTPPSRIAFFWDARTGNPVDTIPIHGFLGFHPDGRTVASPDEFQREVVLRALNRGAPPMVFQGHAAWTLSVAYRPDGKMVAAGSGDHRIRLWDLTGEKQMRVLEGHTDNVTCVAFSPDGKMLASGSWDRSVRLWDVETGKLLKTLEKHLDWVLSLAFSPDGTRLASGSTDRTVRIWEIPTGKLLTTIDPKARHITRLAFSPDGRSLLGVSGDWADYNRRQRALDEAGSGVAILWETATWQPRWRVQVSRESLWASAFQPSGGAVCIAVGGRDGRIRFLDATTGHETDSLAGHTDNVQSLAFSRDGGRIVSGGWDNTIKVWDVASRRLVHIIRGHTDWIDGIALSPDDRTVVSSGFDARIVLSDVTRGKVLGSLVGLDEKDWAVVTPSGRFDASTAGMQQMHWMVGNEPIELAQLKERYFEPGLLAKLAGFSKDPLRDVSAFDRVGLFPEVRLQTPPVGSTQLRLKLVNRGGGIGPVQVFVNGKEFLGDARGPHVDPNARQAAIALDLAGSPALEPGRANVVTVVSYNQGESYEEGFLSSRGTVFVCRPSGARALVPPHLYAIVAGASDFAAPHLRLRFAAKDAEDFAGALALGATRLFGAERSHITLLTTSGKQGSRMPTKANLRKAFQDAKKAHPGDILVVYLAGHGVALGGKHSAYCYLTRDARSGDPSVLADPALRGQYTVTSEELTEWIKQIPALHQVMILDTCAAAAATAQLVDRREVPGDQVRALERLKDRTGFHILMGCAANAVSYETSQYGQGLLTYALLQGMQGAKLGVGGSVDVAPLFQFVRDQVPLLARGIGGIQEPRIAAPKGDDFPIGQLKPEDRKAIVLSHPKPLILRPLLLDSQVGDRLNLTSLLGTRLLEESYAAGRGGEMVYVDAGDMPGAIQPRGIYTVEGRVVHVKMVLWRDGAKIGTLEIDGVTDDLPSLLTALVTEIRKAGPSS